MWTFAARELTELACDWRESADEDVPEITEESFAQRIELTSIAMDPDGSFSAYFDDDDMFFGHCIVRVWNPSRWRGLGGNGGLGVLRAGGGSAIESAQECVEPDRCNKVCDGNGVHLSEFFHRCRGDGLFGE